VRPVVAVLRVSSLVITCISLQAANSGSTACEKPLNNSLNDWYVALYSNILKHKQV